MTRLLSVKGFSTRRWNKESVNMEGSWDHIQSTTGERLLSKDFFNSTGMIIACPVVRDNFQDALHI